MKRLAAVALIVPLASCVLPPPDQPAHYSRAGRFIGLVANCGCGTGLTQSQVMAGFPQVVAGLYSDEDLRRMRGYVEAGATENFDNQLEICLSACSQSCMVNTVAKPLGGPMVGDGETCRITERGLHLTLGRHGDGAPWP